MNAYNFSRLMKRGNILNTLKKVKMLQKLNNLQNQKKYQMYSFSISHKAYVLNI